MIETSIDVICTLDVEGRLIKVSDNCFEVWGWRSEDLLGRPCFNFIKEDERAEAIRDYRRRTSGEFNLPVRRSILRPDGGLVSMYWSISWGRGRSEPATVSGAT